MANTSRPTTCTAVALYLANRADFRGIDESGQVHYLLGMCQALLADANAEILRLELRVKRLEAELEADCA